MMAMMIMKVMMMRRMKNDADDRYRAVRELKKVTMFHEMNLKLKQINCKQDAVKPSHAVICNFQSTC